MEEMTFESFAKRVDEGAKRKNFMLSLYQTLDEYQHLEQQSTDNAKPACYRSCSQCCYQIVCVFPEEMEEIRAYIERQAAPVKKGVRERVRQAVKEWQDYLRKPMFSQERIYHPMKLARDWLGKRCPFLQDDGCCGVYEVRPLVCRTTTSPVCCTSLLHLADGAHSVQMRYECEKWANRLLVEYVERVGSVGVTPLHYFLAGKRFKI